jgi:uncharacterized damage-inducible protein DinB
MKRAGRVGDVLEALEGAFEKRGWHGPTVLESLRGVKPKDATRRPPRCHHSVQELVEHIAHWEEEGLRSIVALGPRSARDWSRPRGSFAASVARMKAVHRRLVAEVALLEDPALDRRVGTGSGRMPLGRVLHGTAAHAAYHAGQIGLVKTLL